MSTIRIRTKPLGDQCLVRILIDHPMETGSRQEEGTGQRVPAHFITELNVTLDGKPVVSGSLTTAVSRNPYFSFRLSQAKRGSRIRVAWLDNLGQKDSAENVIGASVEA